MGVTAVRWWPNGRWIELENRIVSLKLPAGSPLAGQDGERTGASRASRSAEGDATVFTAPAKVTPQALRGEDGALRATRLLEADGTVVLLEPEPEDDDEPPAAGRTEDGDPPRAAF